MGISTGRSWSAFFEKVGYRVVPQECYGYGGELWYLGSVPRVHTSYNIWVFLFVTYFFLHLTSGEGLPQGFNPIFIKLHV